MLTLIVFFVGLLALAKTLKTCGMLLQIQSTLNKAATRLGIEPIDLLGELGHALAGKPNPQRTHALIRRASILMKDAIGTVEMLPLLPDYGFRQTRFMDVANDWCGSTRSSYGCLRVHFNFVKMLWPKAHIIPNQSIETAAFFESRYFAKLACCLVKELEAATRPRGWHNVEPYLSELQQIFDRADLALPYCLQTEGMKEWLARQDAHHKVDDFRELVGYRITQELDVPDKALELITRWEEHSWDFTSKEMKTLLASMATVDWSQRDDVYDPDESWN